MDRNQTYTFPPLEDFYITLEKSPCAGYVGHPSPENHQFFGRISHVASTVPPTIGCLERYGADGLTSRRIAGKVCPTYLLIPMFSVSDTSSIFMVTVSTFVKSYKARYLWKMTQNLVIVTNIWQKLSSVEREMILIVKNYWPLFSEIFGETLLIVTNIWRNTTYITKICN